MTVAIELETIASNLVLACPDEVRRVVFSSGELRDHLFKIRDDVEDAERAVAAEPGRKTDLLDLLVKTLAVRKEACLSAVRAAGVSPDGRAAFGKLLDEALETVRVSLGAILKKE